MCDNVAAGGRPGMSKCPSCVDVMLLPSGMVMEIGTIDSVTFMSVCCGVDRCVVHPVSMMVGTLMLEGGPKMFDVTVSFAILLLLLSGLGSPPSHSSVFVAAAVSVAVVFLVFVIVGRPFFPMLKWVHPPCMSNQWASFLCPSNGRVHVALVCVALVVAPCDQQ